MGSSTWSCSRLRVVAAGALITAQCAPVAVPIQVGPTPKATVVKLTESTLTAEAPWVVQIVTGGGSCSASVLTARWLLTAGHCLEDEPDIIPSFNVYYAPAPGDRRLIYQGEAHGIMHHEHDFGLVYLRHPDGLGTSLSNTSQAKVFYATDSSPGPWADGADDASRYFDIVGWGQASDVGGGDECILPGEYKRIGTNFKVDTGDADAVRITAPLGDRHTCHGDSGAPWLLVRGGVHLVFAVHNGRSPDFLLVIGKEHDATLIHPLRKWMWEASKSYTPNHALTHRLGGTVDGSTYIIFQETVAHIRTPSPPCILPPNAPPGAECQ